MTTKFRFDPGERALPPEEFAEQFFPPDDATRHLPGKHDQKSHGKGGSGSGDAAMPDGWELHGRKMKASSVEPDYYDAKSPGGSGVRVFVSDFEGFTETSAEAHRLAKAATADIANALAPLESHYGTVVAVEVRSLNGPAGQTSGAKDFLGRIPIEVDVGMVVGFAVNEDGWPIWGDDSTQPLVGGSGTGRLTRDGWEMVTSAEGVPGDEFHFDAAAENPLRFNVTHEYGHAVAVDRAYRDVEERFGAPPEVAGLDLVHTSVGAQARDVINATTDEEYGQMSRYGKDSPPEFYAEAFAAWHMRDEWAYVPRVVEVAAETAGWKGAG